MNILQGKIICAALLCVKTHWNSLDSPNIVHRTFLVKIGQGNVTAVLVNAHRRNGGGHFLNQRQLFAPCTADRFG